MKKHQICLMLSDMQYGHFRSLLESEGCESVTEMFRKCVFGRWPIKKQPSAASSKAVPTVESTISQHGHNHAATMPEHGKEEKKEEREKSPHTPLKEKEARKEEPLYACARTREANFVKPTVEEIAAYCRSRNNGLDPEQIWDFYESKGWFIGKTKMKNWRSAVRTWERRRREEQNAAASANANSRYHNGRPKLSNHVDISEEERNEILEGFGF